MARLKDGAQTGSPNVSRVARSWRAGGSRFPNTSGWVSPNLDWTIQTRTCPVYLILDSTKPGRIAVSSQSHRHPTTFSYPWPYVSRAVLARFSSTLLVLAAQLSLLQPRLPPPSEPRPSRKRIGQIESPRTLCITASNLNSKYFVLESDFPPVGVGHPRFLSDLVVARRRRMSKSQHLYAVHRER